MKDHVYKTVELTGTSTESSDEAVRNALALAHKTVKEMRWFQVQEVRGDIDDAGRVAHWQVTLKVGFRIQA